jgi:hypothetical protein
VLDHLVGDQRLAAAAPAADHAQRAVAEVVYG